MMLIVDYLSCAFAILTGVFLLGWIQMRRVLPWKGRKSVLAALAVLVSFLAIWHILFGLVKFALLILGGVL